VPKPKVKLEGGPLTQEAWNRPSHVDPIPLGPPPGLRWIDAQLDAQDRLDRAALIEKEAAARKIDEEIRKRAC